ncbi:hypothetical protein [Nocardia vermiculata]|uniref:Uncharacterized protein n=1 Tax=Nocardia vermiculata TaxID=257274 RepID=A0A846Y3Z9_9NOCA|nr:hypothetical protein [Nocardia vermiculata]NKY54246.1 hypothetical protein [Nocardia vermiculata]
MTDRSTIDTAATDATPEVDRQDQRLDVAPDEPDREPLTGAADREAAEADLVEQSIPVPLDDDYDEPGDTDY